MCVSGILHRPQKTTSVRRYCFLLFDGWGHTHNLSEQGVGLRILSSLRMFCKFLNWKLGLKILRTSSNVVVGENCVGAVLGIFFLADCEKFRSNPRNCYELLEGIYQSQVVAGRFLSPVMCILTPNLTQTGCHFQVKFPTHVRRVYVRWLTLYSVVIQWSVLSVLAPTRTCVAYNVCLVGVVSVSQGGWYILQVHEANLKLRRMDQRRPRPVYAKQLNQP